MASLESRLPPASAEQLGQRLVAQRTADVAARKARVQEVLAGGVRSIPYVLGN